MTRATSSSSRDAVEAGLVGRDPSAVRGRDARARCLVRRCAQGHRLPIADPEGRHAATRSRSRAGLDAHAAVCAVVASTAVADVYEFADGDAPVEALSGTIAAPNARARCARGSGLDRAGGNRDRHRRPRRRAAAARRVLVTRRQPRRNDHAAVSRRLDVSTARGRHAGRRAAIGPTRPRAPRSGCGPSRSNAGRDAARRRHRRIRAGCRRVDRRRARRSHECERLLAGRDRIGRHDVQPRSDRRHRSCGAASRTATTTTPRRPARSPRMSSSRPISRAQSRLRAKKHSACVSAPLVGVHVRRRRAHLVASSAVCTARAPRTCLWQPVVQHCAPARTGRPASSATGSSCRQCYRVGKQRRRAPDVSLRRRAGEGIVAVVGKLVPQRECRRVGSRVEHDRASERASQVVFCTSTRHLFESRRPSTRRSRSSARAPTRRTAIVAATVRLRALGIRAATFRADDPTAVSITAEHDTGCVSMPVYGLQRGLDLRALARYEGASRGDAPRVCLWEEPAGTLRDSANSDEAQR